MNPYRRSSEVGCVAGALITLCLVACTSPAPRGPHFQPAPAPGPGQALVYLYRWDESTTRGELKLKLNSQPLEELRNGEYQALSLPPGLHHLRLTLKLAKLLPTGWNDFSFCLEEGSTNVVRIWAAYSEIDTPEGQSDRLAAPGRADRRASINVFATHQSLETARDELVRRQKAPWKKTRFSRGPGRDESGEEREAATHCGPGRGGGI